MKSGINWKWPVVEDEMEYEESDVLLKIATTKRLKRGVFGVPELKEHWV